MSMKAALSKYLWSLLIAADQLLNAVTGGYPDETFSCRAHREAKSGQWFWKTARRLINATFFWQNDHCLESYQSERLRRHFPAELAD